MQYTEIQPMMNTSKLRDLSDFESPSIIIRPTVDIKPYEDQDFYDKCLEFKTKFKEVSDAIVEIESKAQILNSRCDRMNNLLKLMSLPDGELQESTKTLIRKFVEYYDIQGLEQKIGELHTVRNSMLNVIKLFQNKDPVTLCMLCLENPIEMFGIPCGHTMCTACSGKLKSFTCPFCRAEMERVGNLFLC